MPRILNVPWITKDGYLDLAKFPIDSTLTQAVGDDGEKFHSACRILGSMASAGRTKAGVFLYGLPTFCAGGMAKKQSVVMLWLNPTDNQGVRFLIEDVRAREDR